MMHLVFCQITHKTTKGDGKRQFAVLIFIINDSFDSVRTVCFYITTNYLISSEMGKRNELAILLLFIFNCSFSNGQTNPPTAAPTTTPGPKPVKDSKDFPRQAPFCIEHGADMLDEPSDLQNFAPIFEKHNKENKFVPVSPDKWRSPTGYIKNVSSTKSYL